MPVIRYWFGEIDSITGQLIKHSDVFAEEIRGIRELYITRKVQTGLEQAIYWRETKLQHKIYYVLLERFTWLDFRKVHDYWTPVFTFHVKIAVSNPRGGAINATIVNQNGPQQMRLSLFTEKTLVAEYQDDFPVKKPRFFVDEKKYRDLRSSHDHHIISDISGRGHSWICYYGASDDWDINRSTTAEAFTVSLDWLVMHINKFGW